MTRACFGQLRSLLWAATQRRMLAAILVVVACTQQETDVQFTVQVKTNQGEPVAGATVAVGEKFLGETDQTGALKAKAQLPAGASIRMEVKKESDRYYFAPFYETLSVSNGSSQDVVVAATLYFVPKPSLAGQSDDQTAEAGVTAAAENAVATREGGINLADSNDAKASDGSSGLKVSEKPEGEASAQQAIDEDLAAILDESPEETSVDAKGGRDDLIATDEATRLVPGDEMPTPVTPIAADLGVDGDELHKAASYPKKDRLNTGHTVFTVHAFSSAQPVTGVEILLGEDTDSDLKLGCTTNARGRCVIRFAQKPEGAISFVATKKGYKTANRVVRLGNRRALRFDLEPGQTIDIYAITKTYNYAVGLRDVEVFVAGKKVGNTDKFGRYSHIYAGKPDDLVAISLKPHGYLPETFETDFVASGPMSLVRYFAPESPPPVRVTIFDALSAGSAELQSANSATTGLGEAVREAARKHLFSSAAFKEYQIPLFDRMAGRIGKTRTELLKHGWHQTDMKAVVDAVLQPTLVAGDKPVLELAMVDSKAQVLAAAKEEFTSITDQRAIDRAVAAIAKKLVRVFPFEGAILDKNADKVTINIGYASGRGLKAGDVLEVYGIQSDKAGLSQQQRKIALVTIREIFDQTSKCDVTQMAARATIERGDLVLLRPRKAQEATSAQLQVSSSTIGVPAHPLAQANVYFNDQWLGATDADGRLYADIIGHGTLKIIKHGYLDYNKMVEIKPNLRLDVGMTRETAFLRIDSRPSQATVRIDGKVVGKTPLSTPVAVPAGFVKLELALEGNGAGFKPYAAVLELDDGTLDLTGTQAIVLEPDLRGVAQRLLKAGKIDEAVAKYKELPKEHSDYLLAQHELGEIYLTTLQEPALAAAAFGEVTSNPMVRDFTDKRFIGAHINEGIALFLTAEKLGVERKVEAAAHLNKAIEVFENVIPQLRFVAADQYAQAVHNVDFHRALARHRLWLYSEDPRMLTEAVKSWRSYLDGSARSIKLEDAGKGFVENAEVYYRQAIASMGAAKGVSTQ